MTTFAQSFNDHVRRLARREVRSNTNVLRRASAAHRRDLAALKRVIASLESQLRRAISAAERAAAAAPAASSEQAAEGARFSARSVRAQRKRLGLSAAKFGKLIGVSELTVYHWENGKSRPRAKQLAGFLASRNITKSDALSKLGIKQDAPKKAKAAPAGDGRRSRGSFARTGHESVLAFLKSRPQTTAEINAAWKKEGRAATADVLLGKLVQAKVLKRTKIKGQRGSSYSIA